MLEQIGRFRVVRLKKGRMRTVDLIEDAPTGCVAVLKQYNSGAEAVREYEVLDVCSGDPRVVEIFDFFETKGKWCLLTEYVHGYALNDLVERRGEFEPEKVIDLAVDILQGVKSVHDHGYIHADLHGKNIIVTDFDKASTKIIDFQHAVRKLSSGKARAIRKGERQRLAPEAKSGIIDQRFDIYSVGYMCACLLTGVTERHKLPVVGDGGPMIPTAHPIWEVVKKATHPDPRWRYPSADEMIDDLRRAKIS